MAAIWIQDTPGRYGVQVQALGNNIGWWLCVGDCINVCRLVDGKQTLANDARWNYSLDSSLTKVSRHQGNDAISVHLGSNFLKGTGSWRLLSNPDR